MKALQLKIFSKYNCDWRYDLIKLIHWVCKAYLIFVQITQSTIFKAKQGDVSAYKALMDSAYGGVNQSLEATEGETPIFKQLDLDVID